jgi:quercetin dioxygenase-like cupin family protein
VEKIMKRRVVMMSAVLPLLAAAFLLGGDRGAGAQGRPEIQRKPLLQQDLAIPGHQMVVNIVEIPAGVSEIKHTHPGALSGYVLEGTLVLEREGQPTATFKPGELFYVEAGKIHQGINNGSSPVKIVATLVVEKAKPASAAAQ